MIMPMEIARPPRDIRLALSPASFMTMKVDSRESGRAIKTTRAAPEAAQQQVENDQHQDGPFGQRLVDRADTGLDNVGAVVIGNYLDPFGQHIVLVDLLDFFFDPSTTSRLFSPRSIMTMPPTASSLPLIMAAPCRTASPTFTWATSLI